jgi:hypothetical protein
MSRQQEPVPLEVLADFAREAGMCDCLYTDRSGYVFTRGVDGVSDAQLQAYTRIVANHTMRAMLKLFVGASVIGIDEAERFSSNDEPPLQ